jgi:hypothetical protein
MIDSPKATIVTTGSGWLAGVSLGGPGVHEVDFYLDQDAYVVFSDAVADPAQNGCLFTAGVTRRVECWGAQYVHLKRATGSNATLYYTCRTGSRG